MDPRPGAPDGCNLSPFWDQNLPGHFVFLLQQTKPDKQPLRSDQEKPSLSVHWNTTHHLPVHKPGKKSPELFLMQQKVKQEFWGGNFTIKEQPYCSTALGSTPVPCLSPVAGVFFKTKMLVFWCVRRQTHVNIESTRTQTSLSEATERIHLLSEHTLQMHIRTKKREVKQTWLKSYLNYRSNTGPTSSVDPGHMYICCMKGHQIGCWQVGLTSRCQQNRSSICDLCTLLCDLFRQVSLCKP